MSSAIVLGAVAFIAIGYKVPKTMEELQDLSKTIAADGGYTTANLLG